MREAFTRSKLVAGIISEEHELATEISVSSEANYLLCLDPLDGSGNTTVNGGMGTIFGIFRRVRTAGPVGPADFLRPGRDLVAAGYLLYGPATMLVYTAGEGVHGFTLDRDVGEFMLTHPGLRCPETGPVLAANTGRYAQWGSGARRFVDELTHVEGGHRIRYNGAPVADTHRCLSDGGVFFYPPDADFPAGKLSTLYEAAPLAFIAEQVWHGTGPGASPNVSAIQSAMR